jgi:hypothetical protein
LSVLARVFARMEAKENSVQYTLTTELPLSCDLSRPLGGLDATDDAAREMV